MDRLPYSRCNQSCTTEDGKRAPDDDHLLFTLVMVVVTTAVLFTTAALSIALFVQLKPCHPEVSLTSAVFSSPSAAAVNEYANFQFTFSVHNPNNKFNADYDRIRATVGYCRPAAAELCNPPVLLANSTVPHFLLSGGQTTTVDASLAGYLPPEVAVNGGSGVFVVDLSAKLRFKPWLPWSNEVMAVCRHVVIAAAAAGSLPLLDQPVKCDTVYL